MCSNQASKILLYVFSVTKFHNSSWSTINESRNATFVKEKSVFSQVVSCAVRELPWTHLWNTDTKALRQSSRCQDSFSRTIKSQLICSEQHTPQDTQFPASPRTPRQQTAVVLLAFFITGREVSLLFRNLEWAAQSEKVQFGVKFPEIAPSCARRRRT